jgi:hypothetical protein
MPARQALRYMHTEHRATLRAGPLFIFILYKFSYADFFNAMQILYWTGPIFCFIAFVQLFQACARKQLTLKAILKFPTTIFYAVFYFTCDTRPRFVSIIPTTPRAWD